MKAVIGRYRIGAMMGSKMRLMSSKLPIAMPNGNATASESPNAFAMRIALTPTACSRSFSKIK